MASAAKEKGNSAFKAGDFAGAVGHYSSAIFVDRHDSTLPLNRAAAYIKLGKFEDAERDCGIVLSLTNNRNVKAWFRRAQARAALGKILEARADLNEALKLEPRNDAVISELAKLDGPASKPKTDVVQLSTSPAASSSKPKRVRMPIDVVDTSTGSPRETASKGIEPEPSAPPVRPKRKRIPIEIVDGSSPAQDLSKEARIRNTSGKQPSSSGFAPHDPEVRSPQISTGSIGFFKEVSSRTLNSNEQNSTKTAPSAEGVARAQSTIDASPNPPHSERKQTPNGGIFRTTNTVPPTETPSTKISGVGNDEVAGDVDHTASKSSHLNDGSRSVRPSPSSFYDFIKEWNTASSDQDKWLVFLSIPPSSLKSLFGTSLTPAILMSIIDCAHALVDAVTSSGSSLSSELKSSLRPHLTVLPTVDRFSFLIMFLSPAEKERIRLLLKAVGLNPAKCGWGL